MAILIGNAPCSWGSLEFEGVPGEPVRYSVMLDELRESGYVATELGDWGYMPTDPGLLAAALTTRGLALAGAFVPVALNNPAAHSPGRETAVRTAQLLAETARRTRQAITPFLVLADDNGTEPLRTHNAGRITPKLGLKDREWRAFAAAADHIASSVLEETGLRTVFHHHCAGYVETPDEIDRLLSLTDSRLLGLVFDTGHFAYGAGGAAGILDFLNRHARRIWYMHFKDFDPTVGEAARTNQWDYFDAVRHGVFCELGKGAVDFQAIAGWLTERGYAGCITVEQDVLPGMGSPAESAARNREFLYSIGL